MTTNYLRKVEDDFQVIEIPVFNPTTPDNGWPPLGGVRLDDGLRIWGIDPFPPYDPNELSEAELLAFFKYLMTLGTRNGVGFPTPGKDGSFSYGSSGSITPDGDSIAIGSAL